MFLLILYTLCTLLSSCVSSNITNRDRLMSKHTVMSIFSPMIRSPGPCRYFHSNRKQNRLCRRDIGLPEAINEARRLAVTHCEEQFRYDRWNCSIETRGKRNIFKKVYRETAFVHALTAAAMTYSISRSCADGKMTKCQCAPEKESDSTKSWRWGGCSDNIKHGKRITRNFLDLHPTDSDQVAELLRHDSEVGIQVAMETMQDKCKCHGVSGSCTLKTCWKKMGDFNTTAALLRVKYHQAIRKLPSNKASKRRSAPKQKKSKKESPYKSLLYLETSPTFCSVTRGRRCLHPDNCATLCCGRGYTTRLGKVTEKCRCRFHNGQCCHVICDYCERLELRYYCK